MFDTSTLSISAPADVPDVVRESHPMLPGHTAHRPRSRKPVSDAAAPAGLTGMLNELAKDSGEAGGWSDWAKELLTKGDRYSGRFRDGRWVWKEVAA